LKKAQMEGRKIGADYIVLGGVSLSDGNFRVGSFLLKVSNQEICPLPEVQFDPDLLGASVEIYNMASVMYKRVEGCPDPVKNKVVAIIQTAKKKGGIKSVAVGPAAPPPDRRQPSVALPAPVPVATRGPAVPVKGPAVAAVVRPPAVPRAPAVSPAGPAVPGRRVPAPVVAPSQPQVTSEGLATTGPSALSSSGPVVGTTVVPLPVAEVVRPIDEIDDRGPNWYNSWWFWTIVGVAVVGGGAGGAYYGGLFEGDPNGASVTVRWPNAQ